MRSSRIYQKVWRKRQSSIQLHKDFQSSALPTELLGHTKPPIISDISKNVQNRSIRKGDALPRMMGVFSPLYVDHNLFRWDQQLESSIGECDQVQKGDRTTG